MRRAINLAYLIACGCGSRTGLLATEDRTLLLTVVVEGSGGVTSLPAGIDCGRVCAARFAPGHEIVLAETPECGPFVGWSGDCHGNASCSVVMNANRTVTARFGTVAATGQVLWARAFAGTDWSVGSAIAFAADENPFLTGAFDGALDMDGTTLTTSSSVYDSADGFVAQLSAAGNALWSFRFGGEASDWPVELGTDAGGDLLLMRHSDQFWDGNGYHPGGAFLERFRSFDGQPLWTPVRLWIESGHMAVDASGGVFVAGQQCATVDLDSISTFTVSRHSADDGDVIWLTRLRGACPSANDVDVDVSGNGIVAGEFGGSLDLGSGPLGTLQSVGSGDGFVAVYGPNGTPLAPWRFGGEGYDVGLKIATDPEGGFALVSSVGAQGTTGPRRIEKYSAARELVWRQTLEGATAEIYEVLVDRLGDVVVAGYFSGSLDFGRRTLVSDAASSDAFVAKYRGRDGSLLWVRTLHGPFSDGALGVASDHHCGIVVTGGFTGPTAQLDDLTLEGSAGVGNVFVARLRP